jgi:hypothetical protein
MRRISLLSLLLAMSVSCSTLKTTVETESSDPTKYMNTITADELKVHLYIVASDEMEGRQTGSEGQKRAGQYLISQYENAFFSHRSK